MLNKLAVHRTNYCVAVTPRNIKLVNDLNFSSKGLVICDHYDNQYPLTLKKTRKVRTLRDLDDQAFDRVWIEYDISNFANTELETQEDVDIEIRWALDDLMRVTEHMGMVLISNIPMLPNDNIGYHPEAFTDYLERRAIFEHWILKAKDENHFDILFKVRHHAI